MGGRLRAGRRLLLLALWTLLLIPPQTLAVAAGWRLAVPLARWWHAGCCRLLGVRIRCEGRMAGERPLLFVTNHSTYLDISVLGAVLEACFVSKSDIAGWPIVRTIARLGRTVYVDRRRATTARERNVMAARLQAGDSLVLFPEGTTSDGLRVLPFRSALFSAAEKPVGGRPLIVQPVSVAYVRLNGVPISRERRRMIAWYGEMALASHLWRLLGLGRIAVVLRFHPPVSVAAFASRKALSEHCWGVVAEGVTELLSGRPRLPVPPAPAGEARPAAPSLDSAPTHVSYS